MSGNLRCIDHVGAGYFQAGEVRNDALQQRGEVACQYVSTGCGRKLDECGLKGARCLSC